jgi:polyisoprenoid-binding protein YceI
MVIGSTATTGGVNMKKAVIFASLVGSLLVSSAFAQSRTFNVYSQLETHNVATVESETALENFTGITRKVSGSITFDATARSGSGSIIVNGASIDTGNATRNDHMRSKDWLNFGATPDIRFQTTAVKNLSGDRYQISGNITLNGVTKPVSAEGTVRLTTANQVTQQMGIKGDVLALNIRFALKLSDFGVKSPAIAAGRVNDELQVTLRAVASDK